MRNHMVLNDIPLVANIRLFQKRTIRLKLDIYIFNAMVSHLHMADILTVDICVDMYVHTQTKDTPLFAHLFLYLYDAEFT